MVDEALVLRKLAELEEYLGQVQEYANFTVEQYSKDWRIQRIIERTLQMMIETCADIAGQIISVRGYRIPTSYADSFRVLYEKGNIIFHHYDNIDPEIVTVILGKDLDDFLKYKRAIIYTLENDEKK